MSTFRSRTADRFITLRNDLGAPSNGPTPDHQRPAVHQRHQAPGQHGRVHAPGRRLRAVPAPARPRGALHLRDRRARHARRAGRQGRRAAGRRLLRRSSTRHRRRSTRASQLSFDHFGRSSSPQNFEITQQFARRAAATTASSRSARSARSTRWTTSASCRTATSWAPARTAATTSARGDQCENCTRVLDPTDLIDPRSAISGSSRLEVRETKHLFLLQSKLAGEVEAWVDEHGKEWPTLASSIARKWLTEGLQDRAITRDLDWGVPVPADTWPELAADGQGLLRLVRRPDRVHRRDQGVGRPASRRARDWKSWWCAGRRHRPLHGVHGEGQRPLPHGDVPGHPAGHPRRRGRRSTSSRRSTG